MMKIQFQETEIPYSLTALKGQLKLSGLTDNKIATILAELLEECTDSQKWNESDIMEFIQDRLQRENSRISNFFQSTVTYENLRTQRENMPSIIIVIEGSSATGKSMIALDLIQAICPTRFIGTDTIRQILRNFYTKEEYPELHCHTYQAFKYNQIGDTKLHPIIRGYNAQCKLIFPHIKDMIERIVLEGAAAIVEGVHISPGTMSETSDGIIEILINPTYKTHQAMFVSKSEIGKLKSVSSDEQVRKEEFASTRIIQEHLEKLALQHETAIINLEDYEQAQLEIYRLILERMNHLIELYQ